MNFSVQGREWTAREPGWCGSVRSWPALQSIPNIANIPNTTTRTNVTLPSKINNHFVICDMFWQCVISGWSITTWTFHVANISAVTATTTIESSKASIAAKPGSRDQQLGGSAPPFYHPTHVYRWSGWAHFAPFTRCVKTKLWWKFTQIQHTL